MRIADPRREQGWLTVRLDRHSWRLQSLGEVPVRVNVRFVGQRIAY